MKRCMIYAVIVLFLLPLCGMAKKRTSKEERTNNHSAFLYYREFGPSVIKGFVYLFLIRSIDPLCSWKVIIWEVHPLNTGLAG